MEQGFVASYTRHESVGWRMAILSFLAELKRRKVFRVGAAYVIVAWLLIQVSDTLVPALHLPDWFNSAVVFLLIIGFPIALVFAWAFELSPDGIRRESQSESTDRNLRGRQRTAGVVLMLVAGGVLAYVAIDYFFPAGEQPIIEAESSIEVPPSIAVLPFDNRSADQSDEFFVAGIHDDILTELAKIPGLKVISRTSVMQYSERDRNVRAIGQELDVATILEGGVQRAGDTVRINVQLIDSKTDRHLWAEIYDRELSTSNIFSIQSQIASAIARELHTALSPEQTDSMATAPTAYLQAYDLFQQAKGVQQRWGTSLESVDLYRRAIDLDPRFTEAHISLAQVFIDRFWYFGQREDYLGLARQHLEKAFELDPDSARAHLVLGDYYYKGFLDLDRALEQVNRAIEYGPQLSSSYATRGFILRRSGKLDLTIADLRRALELDPLSARITYTLGQTLDMLGEHEEALALMDRAIELAPGGITFHTAKAHLLVAQDPQSTAMRELLDHPDFQNYGGSFWLLYRWRMSLFERDYEKAFETLSRFTGQVLDVRTAYFPVELMRGLTAHYSDDRVMAREQLQLAVAHLEEQRLLQPEDARVSAALSLAFAGLGMADQAKSTAELAMSLVPMTKDAFEAPAFIMNSAIVYAMLGDASKTAEQFALLESVPVAWWAGPAVIAKHPAFHNPSADQYPLTHVGEE